MAGTPLSGDGDVWYSALLAAFWVRPGVWALGLRGFPLLHCSTHRGRTEVGKVLEPASYRPLHSRWRTPLAVCDCSHRGSLHTDDSVRTGIEGDWLRSNVLERLEVGLTRKLYETEAEQFTCGWLLYISLFIAMKELFGELSWCSLSTQESDLISSWALSLCPACRHFLIRGSHFRHLVSCPFLGLFCFCVVWGMHPRALCLVCDVCALPLRVSQPRAPPPHSFLKQLLTGFWKGYFLDWVSVSWFLFHLLSHQIHF